MDCAVSEALLEVFQLFVEINIEVIGRWEYYCNIAPQEVIPEGEKVRDGDRKDREGEYMREI